MWRRSRLWCWLTGCGARSSTSPGSTRLRWLRWSPERWVWTTRPRGRPTRLKRAGRGTDCHLRPARRRSEKTSRATTACPRSTSSRRSTRTAVRCMADARKRYRRTDAGGTSASQPAAPDALLQDVALDATIRAAAPHQHARADPTNSPYRSSRRRFGRRCGPEGSARQSSSVSMRAARWARATGSLPLRPRYSTCSSTPTSAATVCRW